VASATQVRVAPERHLVLVVEDDGALREAIVALLEAEGYRAVGVGDGAEALEALRTGRVHPCLILLDLMMPRTDGKQFRSEQLGDRALAVIPVVMMSAAVNRPQVNGHGDAFLPKPIDVARMLALVETHCALAAGDGHR